MVSTMAGDGVKRSEYQPGDSERGESMECTECDEHGCPGVVICPQCGIGEHGHAAETHIIDHGICWNCLSDWKMNYSNSFLYDEEARNVP